MSVGVKVEKFRNRYECEEVLDLKSEDKKCVWGMDVMDSWFGVYGWGGGGWHKRGGSEYSINKGAAW